MSIDPRAHGYTAATPSAHSPSHGFDSGPRIRHHSPPGTRQPLADRIERLQLRARVVALEYALAESERQRQAIIDQYELLLETDDESTVSESDDGLLARVCQASVTLGR